MARTYLKAVRDYGHGSLWDVNVLPKMCYDARRQYLVSTNPLSAFLESDFIAYQEHMEMAASDFRTQLVQYTRDQGDRKSPSVGMITKVDHGHLFAMYGCTIVERISANGTVKTFITGMSIVDM
jgi:hypothetical protein